MNALQDLSGQVAAISGGAGDIPGAIALELARRGADIAIGDIVGEEKAAPLLDEIRRLGRLVHFYRVDVTDADAVRDWFAAIEESLGVATLLIVTAATVTLEGIRHITPERWDREIQVNLNGAFRVVQAGALRMLHHGKPGRIVFIGSFVGHAPQTHNPAYCTSKAGIRMLMRCMARDLAPDGILVNEVAPGNVDAGLCGKAFDQFPEERNWSAQQTPVGRNAVAEDVAVQVAHLCDPRNTFMTGTTLMVDGGLSLLSYPKKTSWTNE